MHQDFQGSAACKELARDGDSLNPRLEPGADVIIAGLMSRLDLNGQQGTVMSMVEGSSTQRWAVQIRDEREIALKKRQLDPAPERSTSKSTLLWSST